MNPEGRKQVIIVGAGFAGLWAARILARARVHVLLIDQNNYHTFLTLLYQTAAAELEPEEIVYPIRTILQRFHNVEFVLAQVQRVNLSEKTVHLADRDIPYDYLLLAPGSTPNFYGVPGAKEYAFPLKTLEDGGELRNHILCCFERAAQAQNVELRQREMTFVVVGGGTTGVEFIGALIELIQGPLTRDYPKLDLREARIVMLEATDSLIPGLPESLRTYTKEQLERKGVEIHLRSTVIQVTPQSVQMRDGTSIPTATIIWTGGVQGNPLAEASDLPVIHNGRVAVAPTLQVPGHPEVYVAGDLAYSVESGHPSLMVAPLAIQQGATVARNIMRHIRGENPHPFHYKDPGTMVTIGRNTAVAEVRRHAFTGFFAWLLWVGVHIYNLIGFRNRIFVLINWVWDYFLFDRPVRLILPCRHR